MTQQQTDLAQRILDPTPGTIRVLHVDDDPDIVDLAAMYLEREDDSFRVLAATSAADGLDRLAETDVDCVVSDFDMPGRNGIEFLEAVREEYPDLPFILYTGKGSEEVASEAISAGVSDYLQKGTGTEQYALLANRIRNVVEQARSRRAVERTRERFRTLVEESTDVILVVDDSAEISFATPSAERVLGRSPAELVGTSGFEPVHPDDVPQVAEQFGALVESPGQRQAVEFRYRRPDGSWIWAEARGRNLLDDPVVDGIVVYTRDVTDRKERELELEETNGLLSSLFDTLPVGVLAADAAHDVMAANQRFCDLFDLEGRPADLVGLDCSGAAADASHHVADPESFRQFFDASSEAGDPVLGEAIRLADGRSIRMNYRPIDLPDGAGHLWTFDEESGPEE